MQPPTKVFCTTLAMLALMAGATYVQTALKAPRPAEFVRDANRPLIIPIAGVPPSKLVDTWGQARAQGRTHQGIDIMAPMGTPVHAAGDGLVLKFHDSARGGITIYQADASGRFIFYYAHLSMRSSTLHEGDSVRQGDVLGFVGQTGNATTPHLHFEIERAAERGQWWQGQAFNPYGWLRSGELPPT